jgi:hypothetical protein
MATLPPKVSDEHRWIAIASFTVTEGQARTMAANGVVNLAHHNRIAVQLGCADCEEEWPATSRCSAPAAPELDRFTDDGFDMGIDDRARLLAASNAIGRSGAKDLEIGHLEDAVPVALARWYATARYQGARVTADEHASPIAAVEDLLRRILVGGGCVKCQHPITLPDQSDAGSPDRCTWTRHHDMWVPGCVENVHEYIAERKGHR